MTEKSKNMTRYTNMNSIEFTTKEKQDKNRLKKGINFIKKLGLMPPNKCTPSHLASYFEQVECSNWSDHPGIDAVGAGYGFLGMSYIDGNKLDDSVISVVGKGITFDSGGISIKPSKNMGDMKFDMLGCATALALKKTLVDHSINVNLYGCIAENVLRGNIMRPGDVIKYPNGTKVEIDNTDAEGRLVLADGILKAKKDKNTKLIITIATLTGSARAALGEATALFSNNRRLTKDFLKCAAECNEEVWQLPIFPHHREAIKVNKKVADIKNCADIAGASTAAAFLEHFVEDTPWIHLDIAGSAYKDKMPTGAMLATLTKFISEYGE